MPNNTNYSVKGQCIVIFNSNMFITRPVLVLQNHALFYNYIISFQNGKFAVVGTYDGRCIFYLTDTLKYHTMIHVRSSRGKNSQGRKVTGIEPMPGEDKV